MDDALGKNRLLARLPRATLEALASELVERPLDAGQVLVAQGEVASSVWFPLAGAISLTPESREGSSVQATIVGHEGMIDPTTIFSERGAPWHATVLLGGSALVMGADRFRARAAGNAPLLSLVHVYAGAIVAQLAQSALCSRFHSVRERTARWLLGLQDRSAEDSFPLTQQDLADMVGTHRPTISITVNALSQMGLIAHSRGVVTVCDRAGLEAAACECYARADGRSDRITLDR